jgi:hypothetical protein
MKYRGEITQVRFAYVIQMMHYRAAAAWRKKHNARLHCVPRDVSEFSCCIALVPRCQN